MNNCENRNTIIMMTSFIGIITNLVLSVCKIIVGALTNSIAITLDAINNLSDMASSIITIVGEKLAVKEADQKHPFGHGRMEYVSALIISLIVLYAGISSLEKSIKSILHPEMLSYNVTSLIVVTLAILVKIVLGSYYVKEGKKVNSNSLVNSGKDALLDSVISFGTLLAAVIYLLAGVSLEAYLGVAISIVILKSGWKMMMEPISKLLGEHLDQNKIKAITDTILEFPDVKRVYDLVLNDYGPEDIQGSVHIDVPDTYTTKELDKLSQAISLKVLNKHQVWIRAVGIGSVNIARIDAIEVKYHMEGRSYERKSEYNKKEFE